MDYLNIVMTWLIGGPDLLYVAAVKFPFYFFCSFLFALGLAGKLVQNVDIAWKKISLAIVSAYLFLLSEWFIADRVFNL